MRLWLLAAVSVVACRTTGQDPSAAKIIGGTEVASADAIAHATVAIVTFGPFPYISCSGTLIGDHAILTAAHCQTQIGDRIGFGTLTQDTASSVIKPVPTNKVTQVIHHGCYDSDADMWDVAVVLFNGDVPQGYGPPVPLGSDGLTPTGASVVAAGYGLATGTGELTDGKLRQVPLVVTAETTTSANQIGARGTSPGHGVCHGDSGGPLYVSDGGLLKIVGLTHGGTDEQGPCDGLSIFQSVPKVVDWIKVAMTNTEPPLAPGLCASPTAQVPPPPPPEVNDQLRGPSACRLTADQDVTKVQPLFGSHAVGNPMSAVADYVVLSAPDKFTRINVVGPDGNTVTLSPSASGKGRNCFEYQPKIGMGATVFHYATNNPDSQTGAFTLNQKPFHLPHGPA